jgi:hypothetical protein
LASASAFDFASASALSLASSSALAFRAASILLFAVELSMSSESAALKALSASSKFFFPNLLSPSKINLSNSAFLRAFSAIAAASASAFA